MRGEIGMAENTRQHPYKRNMFLCSLLFATFVFIFLNSDRAEATELKVKTYTVKVTTTPINTTYMKYSVYNKYTNQYYMLRSYLEQLEMDGGGTLILTAGTYKICNTLYVPSHVTIYFEDGVIIKKTGTTGTSLLQSSASIFQLVAPSKSRTKSAYGGYNGETDIQLIGKGTAIIDLNFLNDVLGLIIGHNTDVTISGITFKNMQGGHFIELDASQNVTIENNIFIHHKSSASGIKEAINLDTPDKSTGGLHAIWTNYDCTPNKDILIQNNYFDDLERAIGTHKYSGGKYHENVQILNNKVSNTTSDAIRILNWLNPVIKDNEIKMVAESNSNKRAILASGLINPTITNNTFMEAPRPIQIMPWKNTDGGSQYAITYNDISVANMSLMLKNKLVHVGEKFIRVNKRYNIYSSYTDKYYFYSEQKD